MDCLKLYSINVWHLTANHLFIKKYYWFWFLLVLMTSLTVLLHRGSNAFFNKNFLTIVRQCSLECYRTFLCSVIIRIINPNLKSNNL